MVLFIFKNLTHLGISLVYSIGYGSNMFSWMAHLVGKLLTGVILGLSSTCMWITFLFV